MSISAFYPHLSVLSPIQRFTPISVFNNLLTESEGSMKIYQTEVLLYWPRYRSVWRVLVFSHTAQTNEVRKFFNINTTDQEKL